MSLLAVLHCLYLFDLLYNIISCELPQQMYVLFLHKYTKFKDTKLLIY